MDKTKPKRNYNTRKCYLCGSPCSGKSCRACYSYAKHSKLSGMYRARRYREGLRKDAPVQL